MILLFLIVSLAPAHAKVAKAPEPVEFTVSVPKGEIDVESTLEVEDRRYGSSIELAVTDWSPRNYSRPTYTGNPVSFDNQEIPTLSLTRIKPISAYSNGASISLLMGVGFSSLSRTAAVNTGSVSIQNSQTLQLLAARLGVEYQGLTLWQLHPIVSLLLKPTYAFSGRSALEDRVSKPLLLGEGSAGLLYQPKWFRDFAGFSQGSMGLMASYTFGRFDGADLSGLGAQGFVRIKL